MLSTASFHCLPSQLSCPLAFGPIWFDSRMRPLKRPTHSKSQCVQRVLVSELRGTLNLLIQRRNNLLINNAQRHRVVNLSWYGKIADRSHDGLVIPEIVICPVETEGCLYDGQSDDYLSSGRAARLEIRSRGQQQAFSKIEVRKLRLKRC